MLYEHTQQQLMMRLLLPPLQLLDLGFLATWTVLSVFTLLTPPQVNQVGNLPLIYGQAGY